MFEELHLRSSAIARHRNAPLAEERARYLSYCADRGDSPATLYSKANGLIYVARQLSACANLEDAIEQLKAVAQDSKHSEHGPVGKLNTRWAQERFICYARPWLRFLGWWPERVVPTPFHDQLEVYCHWMKHARGMTEMTVSSQHSYLAQFLRWYGAKGRPLTEVQAIDIDLYLAEGGAIGWCRRSVGNVAAVLRAFFRYGAVQGWSPPHLADAIHAPRVYAGETLPAGPDWTDVQRMLAAANTERPKDLRDRPILMLFAIYGLRETEVAKLQLDDLDWEREVLHVTRVKRRGTQTYPLLPSIGHAIIRYLQIVRQPSTHRQVFLALRSPFRPLSQSALYGIVCERLTALGVRTAHRGPHSLRHACAARLVADGLSLKEIGDHLGHRSASATRIYAKVDLLGLREVASFDLGGLL